ncbi:hypothetical protein [Empedobacter stercoris]|uniref:hypothetical protein n=1 Tax=Empedobacter stercoris TaxID=1628248 RepID=UPI0039ED09B1
MENTPDKLKIDNQFLTTDEINKIIPEALIGDAFHIKVSKQTAEYLIANDIVNDIMNAEYGNDGFYGEQWTGMTKDDFNDETQKFDDDYQTFEIDVNPITRTGLENLLATIQNINNMETQKEFNQVQYLKDQLKYLGFGESEKLHKDLENGINSNEKSFEIKTTSDKTLPENKVDFNIKFNKSEKGGVFLNSYSATLSNNKGENVSQNFTVNKENAFTAKEAVNLLEGRSVKIEFDNPKTAQKETAFVKLNFAEEKNTYGNYNFQTFHQNYGVDAKQIVEKSNLIFDKPEYKDSVIKSLEKGNVVKVKFELEDKIIEGKAVLNPQYKNLNLYDSDMNRLNTNKPLQGMDNDNKHEKSNVREQSMSRGI